jgi:hypothetical protein
MTSQPPYPHTQPTEYMPPAGGGVPPQWAPPGPPQAGASKKRRWLHYVCYPVVLLVGVGIGSAGGSSGEGTVTTQPETSASAEPTQAPGVAPGKVASAPAKVPAAGPGLGDKVRDGKFEFTVTKVRPGVASVGDSTFGKKAQGQFVLVSVTVSNIGEEPQTLVGDAQKLFDTQGREFSVDTEAAIYLAESNSIFEEINPGNSVKGTLLYDIPDGVKPVKLELHDSAFSGGVEVTLR